MPQDALKTLKDFQHADEKGQRAILESKEHCEKLLRVLFSIVEKIKSEPDMTLHALALINGIIEDKRSRIRFLVGIQKSQNEQKKMDLVGILKSFLVQNLGNDGTKQMQRDLAAHVLVILIENLEYKNCAVAARQFLSYLFENRRQLHTICFTHCLMFLMKTNELALEFVNKRGFEIYVDLLKNECLSSGQVAYNTVCALWILSHHSFAIQGLTDFTLSIVELVTKVLDYFNKEKIVRAVLMLFDVSPSP